MAISGVPTAQKDSTEASLRAAVSSVSTENFPSCGSPLWFTVGDPAAPDVATADTTVSRRTADASFPRTANPAQGIKSQTLQGVFALPPNAPQPSIFTVEHSTHGIEAQI